MFSQEQSCCSCSLVASLLKMCVLVSQCFARLDFLVQTKFTDKHFVAGPSYFSILRFSA